MTNFDLSTNRLLDTEPETQEEYPDEVLESEWNPILAEIQSVRPNMPEPPKPVPLVIDAAVLRRYH